MECRGAVSFFSSTVAAGSHEAHELGTRRFQSTDSHTEVTSTYSPSNPMADLDIGALIARKQGNLADLLYPFKLVYDDGTERLGCDMARERGESFRG